jgi:threonylcarbamoyladenosine tRNA methylthiotransferase MtaB
LTYLHVFTYSPRPGTPAAAMKDQVPVQEARARNRVLRELAEIKGEKFKRSFAGQIIPAITLGTAHAAGGEATPNFSTEALTDNYLRLVLRGKHDPNQWVQARIDHVTSEGLVGSAA